MTNSISQLQRERIEGLKRELASLAEQPTRDLREALETLRELYDWQNGPPLQTPTYEDGWGAAMQKAAYVLRKHGA